ncbi:unnamed protein product [Mycena citricolor]|uniref:Kinetochore protein NDC80 n=1 Tax=Mycena citricolor TaxID=2018698 RepID=A0AAD2HP75_9AGAR|nr:unnamed protein product [Mycena citricolor]
MMDRRRSTLQPSSDMNATSRSAIPVPATVRKPNPSRMSVAGPSFNPPPPSSNPRQSMMRSQNMNPLLQSASKTNYGRTPLNNSTRRGSMWPGAANMPPPPSSQTMKDTRPLREKSFQITMKQDISQYLRSVHYDIGPATLNNIQGKEYRAIVEFLILQLDPYHPFDPASRMEDEFIPALRALRYPFVNSIDVKSLAAPASMHYWPAFLGVMHWLVECCKAIQTYEGSGDPTLQIAENIPDEFEDPMDHQALAFEYYEQAYALWMNMVDDFVEPKQSLEDRYARKNGQAQLELEETTAQLEQGVRELEKLKAAADPLAKLQNENATLKQDCEKFLKILKQYESRKKKLMDQITFEKAELITKGNQLEQLKSEQSRLAEIVKTQNLTPEEVIKMNTDHETLTQNLRDLEQKIAETNRHVMTLEVNVTNRAAAAEEAIDSYTNLLTQLELFPPLAPPLEDVDLTLDLNTASSNPHNLLSGADIRRVIKPALSAVAEAKRSARANVESERIKLDNELDQVTLECENIEEEIVEVEKKVVALNDQADDLREVAQQEAVVANAEANRLEKELANARTAALGKGTIVRSRLQTLQFNYREQVEKVARLKDETVRAILKNTHEIAIFKDEVSRCLSDLRLFAEGE